MLHTELDSRRRKKFAADGHVARFWATASKVYRWRGRRRWAAVAESSAVNAPDEYYGGYSWFDYPMDCARGFCAA